MRSRPTRNTSKKSGPEEELFFQMSGFGLWPEREHRFHPVRRWRFDFAFPDLRIAVEVEGGIYLPGGGRHNRGAGMEKDLEKYGEAQLLGWTVYRCSSGMVKSGAAVQTIRALVELKRDELREAVA